MRFNPDRLKADLARVAVQDWTGHFERLHYDRGWDGAALRSSDGQTSTLRPGAAGCLDTNLLRICPYFREIVAQFQCPKRRVRLLRLAAGARIKKHVDYRQSLDHGLVRLHIPIEVNPRVEFRVAGKRVVMREGECWYVNASYPHSVFNGGDRDRVHLVLDCEVNAWLRSQFPATFSKASRLRMAGYWVRWHRYRARDHLVQMFQDPGSIVGKLGKYLHSGTMTFRP